MTKRDRRRMLQQMKDIERGKETVSKTEKALLAVILFAIDFVLTGYVTCYIWNTVIISFLPVRAINFWQGWALSFAIRYFLPKGRDKKEDMTDLLFTDIVYTVFVWLFIFLVATFAGL